jgi:hypothetical protein
MKIVVALARSSKPLLVSEFVTEPSADINHFFDEALQTKLFRDEFQIASTDTGIFPGVNNSPNFQVAPAVNFAAFKSDNREINSDVFATKS